MLPLPIARAHADLKLVNQFDYDVRFSVQGCSLAMHGPGCTGVIDILQHAN